MAWHCNGISLVDDALTRVYSLPGARYCNCRLRRKHNSSVRGCHCRVAHKLIAWIVWSSPMNTCYARCATTYNRFFIFFWGGGIRVLSHVISSTSTCTLYYTVPASWLRATACWEEGGMVIMFQTNVQRSLVYVNFSRLTDWYKNRKCPVTADSEYASYVILYDTRSGVVFNL